MLNGEGKPIDIGIYDIAQCFDSIWLDEAMNDLYDVLDENMRNDKLALIYQMNRNNKVFI